MTTTIVALLDSLRTHLTAFELPELCSMHVTRSASEPNVTGQLACHQPPQITSGLLAWADTLTGVTAQAWRVPTGDRVHLSVTGCLPGGVSVQIYGGVPLSEHGPGADLAPNARTTVPLTVLRQRTTVEEMTG